MTKGSIKNKNVDKCSEKMLKKTSRKKLLSYRTKMLLKSVIIILLVLLVGLAISFMIFFKVKKIEARGSAYYTENEIIKNSSINKSDNLFFLDSRKIQENIEKRLPYIEKATIQKSVPDKVIILIEDARPTGVVSLDDETKIGISQGRKVLGPIDEEIDDLFYIEGVKFKNLEVGEILKCEDEFTEKVMASIFSMINEGKLKDITRIDLSNLTKITLEYQKRIEINLGTFENIDYKIRTAYEIICNKIENNEHGILNLSKLDEGDESYFMPISIN